MKLTPKQKEYIVNANRRWNFKTGATGAGKSFIDSVYVIPQRILERKGQSGLNVIMGVTKETIERNILEPMRTIYGDVVGTINSRNTANLFGENVYCLGAEKINQVNKIQGATFKYLYGDEVAKWHEDVFNFAKSRLRSPVSCFDGTLNPENPGHYLYKFLYETESLDLYHQHYTIDDNPFYPEKEKNELKKEYYGTFYYDRYILGLWKKAEGLVYANFSKDKHVVPTIPRQYSEYQVSIDYGTYNPFHALLWGKCGNTWYCVEEFVYNGRQSDGQLDPYQYMDRLKKWENVRRYIVDPSADAFITTLKNNYKSVKPADNRVSVGITAVTTALNKGLIKINDCCKELIKELEQYSWDEKKGEDTPLKQNDHGVDSLRYFVLTNKLTSGNSKYPLTANFKVG